eukprot:g38709.t1
MKTGGVVVLIIAGVLVLTTIVRRRCWKRQRDAKRKAAKPEEYKLPSLSSRWEGKSPGFGVPRAAVVTGGSGFVGQRLVEMLQERGCERVVSFNIEPTPADARVHPSIVYIQGDLINLPTVQRALQMASDFASGRDCCVFHLAALVGPFHPEYLYDKVNIQGTENVITAAKELGIGKVVFASSPATRMDFSDCSGLNEEDFRHKNHGEYSRNFTHAYARTKAASEKLVTDANDGKSLLTIAVAPHQVYGPGDRLFFPHLLSVAKTGKLRIFGNGLNWISVTYIDNYCHGLLCAHDSLHPSSPSLGRYYVVTDGPPVKMWEWIDQTIVDVGLSSLSSRFALPEDLMEVLGWLAYHAALLTAALTGQPRHLMIKKFTLSPFTVKMLLIDRWFKIDAAIEDLGYQPLFKDTADAICMDGRFPLRKEARR